MIHIVFGKSAEGSVRYTFRGKKDQVIGFPIDFSVGPITNIDRKEGSKQYFDWLKSNYSDRWSSPLEDETAYHQAMQKVAGIQNGSNVTIWTCENASEQIGLRICCYLLKEKEVTLNFVNTYKAMKALKKRPNFDIEIRHTGECLSEDITSFYSNSSCSIPNRVKLILEKEGNSLIQSNSFVRSWVKGEIVHELETRDDSFILNHAKEMQREIGDSDFVYVARVIGEVLGHATQPLSDAWIEYRIRVLIHSGVLDYKGDLHSIHMYKIKVI